MHGSAEIGHVDICRLLLQHNASPNAQDVE
jgi:hypothetical protein